MADAPKGKWTRDEIVEALGREPSLHEVLNGLLHSTVDGMEKRPLEPGVRKDLLDMLFMTIYFGSCIDAARRIARAGAKMPELDAKGLCAITESVLQKRFEGASARLQTLFELFKETK